MNQLILHPRDMNVDCETPALLEALHHLKFIAEAFDFAGQQHYRPGEDFLELMTFLGCSPVVSLGEPGLTGEDFCHIAILPAQAEPQFVYGSNVKTPRCPHCRHPHNDWQHLIKDWAQDKQGYRHTCPQCHHEYAVPQFKWRQSAGFLSYGIVIWGIYEGEAVPSDRLLACLEQQSQTKWGYFYLRQNTPEQTP